MNNSTLIIRHVGNDPDRFEVMRSDGKRTRAVEIESPDRFPVEGWPKCNLPHLETTKSTKHTKKIKKYVIHFRVFREFRCFR